MTSPAVIMVSNVQPECRVLQTLFRRVSSWHGHVMNPCFTSVCSICKAIQFCISSVRKPENTLRQPDCYDYSNDDTLQHAESINVSVEPDLDTCDTALKNAACVGDQRMVTTPSKATQSSRVTRTAKNQAYPRKVAPTISRQAADAAERYISSMKAHFDEVRPAPTRSNCGF
jgi:hypothetical protein